jgi:hypothetical protein
MPKLKTKTLLTEKVKEAKVSGMATTDGSLEASPTAAMVPLENRRGVQCQFARCLGCMGMHASPHKCSIFLRDLAPDEKEKIIRDNNMFPFRLRRGTDQDRLG